MTLAATFTTNLWLDVRYAFRVLRKSPTLSIAVFVTLLLTIGANVVVFGVLNAVLLAPLPVSDPASLYQLRHQTWRTGRLITTSYPAFEDFERRNTTFSGLAALNAYSVASMTWRGSAARSLAGDSVSGNYFDLLGVQPQAGRFFHAADEHGTNSAPYIVLSDKLWRSAFNRDGAVIGSTIELDHDPFTVIGVAGAEFHGTERFVWPDYWLPIVQQSGFSDSLHNRNEVSVTVLGRLRPGATAQQATDDLNRIAAQLAREYPHTDDGQLLRLIHPGLFGDEGDVISGFLWSVSALAMLVLAAACANLAALFAARAADRSQELALRLALGASRQRLTRQLLTEAFLISLLGGGAGLVAALLLLRGLNQWQPAFGGHLAVNIDVRVYLAGLGLTALSAMIFGLIPARHAWRSSPLQGLKGGSGDALYPRRFALPDLLLGAQISICTLLVTASLVAMLGMQRTLQAPLGFKPQGAVLADIDSGQRANVTVDETSNQRQAILQAIGNIPGVTTVGEVSRTPMTGGMRGVPIFSPGTLDFALDHAVLAPYVFSMSPGYLEAAGSRLLGGRDVAWQDRATTPYVAIVNETFAHSLWPKAQPIGQRFVLRGHLTEVVGVVQDGKYHDLHETPQPVAYVPYAQSDETDGAFVVRSQRAPNELGMALERVLRGIGPDVTVTVQSWPETMARELFPARAAAGVLGIMGAMAAMLAVTGLFGMAAYGVSRRKKELGIRMAMGAGKPQVMQAALGRPMLLLVAGSLVGLGACMAASPLLARIVYQANPRDPLVVGGAVLTMMLLGLMAAAIPARRALGIDPTDLMREQ